MKHRPRRCEEDYKELAPHITKEFLTMVGAFEFIRKKRTIRGTLLNRIMLEAFLLHYRILREFFWHEGGTVLASSYVPEWKRIRPSWTDNVDRELDRLNAQLAHVNCDRIDFREWTWPIGKMCEQARQFWVQFLEALPTERKSWFNVSEDEVRGLTFRD
jgi:hypothetical protein